MIRTNDNDGIILKEDDGFYNSMLKTPNNDYVWNVVKEEDFKQRLNTIFQMVSDSLSKTLGPYGSTTIIEKFGDIQITKDGWSVLKKINFKDQINQTIMQLLFGISSKVVIKVGDGSTSAIVSANSVLKVLENDELLKSLRSKDLITRMNRLTKQISDEILKNAIKIDTSKDSDFEQIYKLAMISTNGDEEVSRMIQKIYKETENPFIEFSKSKTFNTSMKVVKGYKADITYLDEVFVTNEEGTCELKNPFILMFEQKLELDDMILDIMSCAITKAAMEDRKIVIIAPYYDKLLLNRIRDMINASLRAKQPLNTIYCRTSLLNNISYDLYNDFSVMAGATVIRDNNLSDLYEKYKQEDKSEFVEMVESSLGTVEKMSIGQRTTTIEGFNNLNDDIYQTNLNSAIARYTKTQQESIESGRVFIEANQLKQRVAKLKGKMGVIEVGGNSELEKSSNYDLVEDAIKACESAYNYGYNMGGNLIIPATIYKLLSNDNDYDKIDIALLNMIATAFSNVFKRVMYNKFEGTLSEDEYNEIINKSINRKECYNLLTETFDKDVINSCYTDVEILNATTSIVSLLVSSNQYISISMNEKN